MKAIRVPQRIFMRRLLRLLRVRVWLQERIQLTEWQIMVMWAAVAGFAGALVSMLFTGLTENIYSLFGQTGVGIVESMQRLPWWGCLLVPTVGGVCAGLVLQFGQHITRAESSTDYMEAIVIGSGRLPVRTSVLKSVAALFSIGSGGSIGREGPMVQLASVAASYVGRLRKFSPPQLRLLIACGAAAGIASPTTHPSPVRSLSPRSSSGRSRWRASGHS
jgi:CIC family chloride channel protein